MTFLKTRKYLLWAAKMTYKKFTEDYLAKGLIKKQRADLKSTEKLIIRAQKDLQTAKANLIIDEGVAYTVAYLAMLRSARAFMLLKGFRPSGGKDIYIKLRLLLNPDTNTFFGKCLSFHESEI